MIRLSLSLNAIALLLLSHIMPQQLALHPSSVHYFHLSPSGFPKLSLGEFVVGTVAVALSFHFLSSKIQFVVDDTTKKLRYTLIEL